MLAHRDAMAHSPALWGLLGACAAELVLVVAWNVWQRHHDSGVSIGERIRSAARI
jgi:hypothetical protein